MNRREAYESWWADQNDVPVESMAQYRCDDDRKYRLPKMAKGFRIWCAALDSVSVDLSMAHMEADESVEPDSRCVMRTVVKSIEAAGLRVMA